MTRIEVVEENGRTAEREGSCGCGCGCGMGAAPETREDKAESRERRQAGGHTEATHRTLGEPYGCCGTRRFS